MYGGIGQIIEDARFRHHVAEFSVNIKQVPIDGSGNTITYAFFDSDRPRIRAMMAGLRDMGIE